MGVPIIRAIRFGSLYWGLPILRNYYIGIMEEKNGNDYNKSYLGFRAYGLGSSRLGFVYRGSQGCIGSRGINGEADGNTMEIYTEAEVK